MHRARWQGREVSACRGGHPTTLLQAGSAPLSRQAFLKCAPAAHCTQAWPGSTRNAREGGLSTYNAEVISADGFAGGVAAGGSRRGKGGNSEPGQAASGAQGAQASVTLRDSALKHVHSAARCPMRQLAAVPAPLPVVPLPAPALSRGAVVGVVAARPEVCCSGSLHERVHRDAC